MSIRGTTARPPVNFEVMAETKSNHLDWTPVALPCPVTLRGRSVTLEPLDAARHAASLWRDVHGHDELWRWMPDGPYVSEPDLRQALHAKQTAQNTVFLAIVPAETGLAATEAMFLMAGHIFDGLGYRRYEWKCNAENEPSRRAALRLGFKFEGIFRQHMVVKGRNRDTAWFAMLDHEWPARQRAFTAWLEPGNFDNAGKQRKTLQEITAAEG